LGEGDFKGHFQMKTVEEFKQYYEQRILPDLKPLEEKRKVASRKSKRLLISCLVLMVAVLTTMGFLHAHPLVLALTFFGFVVAAVVGSLKLSGGFQEELKRILLERTLSFMYPDVAYDPRSVITRDTVFGSGIFDGELPDPYRAGNPLDTALNQVARHFDRFLGLEKRLIRQAWKRVSCARGDAFKGRIGDRDVMFGELHVHVPRERGPGASGSLSRQSGPSTRTLFRGLFYVIDMGQQFRGRTLVRPLVDASLIKSELLQNLKSAAEYIDGTSSIEGEVVKFNDTEFDRFFMVHAADPSAARVFLTPELRKRLTELRRKHGPPLRASFTGTKAYLAVHHAEMFEASLHQSALDFSLARKYFEEMRFAVQIVEDLVV
jgi:hypothetical protein